VPEQAARYDADEAWQEKISEYLAVKNQVTVGRVAREALCLETPRIGTADQRRITNVLEILGWRRLPKDSEGKRWWAKA
jgi:hypothetical protein